MDADDFGAKYLAALAAQPSVPSDTGEGADEPDVLMATAQDASRPVAERLSALQQLNARAFNMIEFAPYAARFDQMLKSLCTDKSAKVRLAAFQRLGLSPDAETRRLLHDSLAGTGEKLVPDLVAATLLGFDDHASSRDLLAQLAGNSDGKLRRAALRGLSGDPSMAGRLRAIATDRTELSKVRQTAALALKSASASDFADMAQQLVADPTEDSALRALTMSALAHGGEVRAAAAASGFSARLDDVAANTMSRSLKRSIKLFKQMAK